MNPSLFCKHEEEHEAWKKFPGFFSPPHLPNYTDGAQLFLIGATRAIWIWTPLLFLTGHLVRTCYCYFQVTCLSVKIMEIIEKNIKYGGDKVDFAVRCMLPGGES